MVTFILTLVFANSLHFVESLMNIFYLELAFHFVWNITRFETYISQDSPCSFTTYCQWAPFLLLRLRDVTEYLLLEANGVHHNYYVHSKWFFSSKKLTWPFGFWYVYYSNICFFMCSYSGDILLWDITKDSKEKCQGLQGKRHTRCAFNFCLLGSEKTVMCSTSMDRQVDNYLRSNHISK